MESNLQYAGAVHPLGKTRRAVPEPKVRKLSVPRCPAESAGAFIRRRVRSSSRRNLSIDLAETDAARIIPPRRHRSVQNSDETSKPLPVSCGTESSNPFPASGESCELSTPPRRAVGSNVQSVRSRGYQTGSTDPP